VKKAIILLVFLSGCTGMTGDQAAEMMGGPSRSIPRLMDGLSDGRAVVCFSDGYTREVKLIDPKTGHGENLDIGSGENFVLAIRVGWGDTIFVATQEQGHIKLHKFTPQGVPRGKHVLKDAEIFVDFLVAKSEHPTGSEILTLNMAGPMCTSFDGTGKPRWSAGPSTPPEGPYLYAYVAVAPATGKLLVIPQALRSNCADCPNYIEGPIRVYGLIGGETTPSDSFPFLGEIDLSPIIGDADAATALAARGDGYSCAYLFMSLTEFDEENERVKVSHALVKVDPSTDPRKYEVVRTDEYEELYWGEDGRLYDKEGNLKPAITCAAIKDQKLFLAYGDGHVEVCEIGE